MTQQELVVKKEILRMMAGFRRFRDRFFKEGHSVYDSLSTTGKVPRR